MMQGRRGDLRERRPAEAVWSGGGNLLAVLAFYFVIPLDTGGPTIVLLVASLATLASVSIVAGIVVREAPKVASGVGGGLKGLHLVLALEVVLVGLALVYYLLAVNASGEMSGIHTRLDALYFTSPR